MQSNQNACVAALLEPRYVWRPHCNQAEEASAVTVIRRHIVRGVCTAVDGGICLQLSLVLLCVKTITHKCCVIKNTVKKAYGRLLHCLSKLGKNDAQRNCVGKWLMMSAQ